MLSQRQCFTSTPLSAMQLHPFRSPSHFGEDGLLTKGILLGINMLTGNYVMLHPWWLKKLDLIDACTILHTGLRGCAKSSCQKCMTGRLLGLRGGVLGGVEEEARGRSFSRKRIDGEAEEKAFTDFLVSDVHDLSTFAPNVFEPRIEMGEADLVRQVVMNAQFVNGGRLSPEITTMYQIAVERMRAKMPRLASNETFMEILRHLSSEDADDYYSSRSQRFRENVIVDSQKELNELMEDQKKGIVIQPEDIKELEELIKLQQQPSTLSKDTGLQHELLRGAHQGMILWDNVMRLLGGAKGTKNSLYDALTAPMTTFDLSDLGEDERSLYEININCWSAGAQNRGDFSLIPHVETWDEEQEGADNLTHLQTEDRASRKARSSHVVKSKVTQFELSLRYAGPKDSEIRRRSIAINDGVAIHIDGRQPDTPEYREWLRTRGYSPPEVNYLCTEIPKGTFMVQLKGQPAVPVAMLRMPEEMTFTETDSVEARMTDPDVQAGAMEASRIWRELMEDQNRNLEFVGGDAVPEAIMETVG